MQASPSNPVCMRDLTVSQDMLRLIENLIFGISMEDLNWISNLARDRSERVPGPWCQKRILQRLSSHTILRLKKIINENHKFFSGLKNNFPKLALNWDGRRIEISWGKMVCEIFLSLPQLGNLCGWLDLRDGIEFNSECVTATWHMEIWKFQWLHSTIGTLWHDIIKCSFLYSAE